MKRYLLILVALIQPLIVIAQDPSKKILIKRSGIVQLKTEKESGYTSQNSGYVRQINSYDAIEEDSDEDSYNGYGYGEDYNGDEPKSASGHAPDLSQAPTFNNRLATKDIIETKEFAEKALINLTPGNCQAGVEQDYHPKVIELAKKVMAACGSKITALPEELYSRFDITLKHLAEKKPMRSSIGKACQTATCLKQGLCYRVYPSGKIYISSNTVCSPFAKGQFKQVFVSIDVATSQVRADVRLETKNRNTLNSEISGIKLREDTWKHAKEKNENPCVASPPFEKLTCSEGPPYSVYMIEEFLGGGSMQDPQSGMNIGSEQVAQALLCGVKQTHNCGYIHRDIHPGNIVFTSAGEPKLSDFGIAADMHKGKLNMRNNALLAALPVEEFLNLKRPNIHNLRNLDLVNAGQTLYFSIFRKDDPMKKEWLEFFFSHKKRFDDFIHLKMKASRKNANITLKEQVKKESEALVTLLEQTHEEQKKIYQQLLEDHKGDTNPTLNVALELLDPDYLKKKKGYRPSDIDGYIKRVKKSSP